MVYAVLGKPITNGEIPFYCNEFFYSCLRAWHLTKMWGLANGAIGWANESQEYIDAITTLESESNRMEQEEMEAANKKATSKTKG